MVFWWFNFDPHSTQEVTFQVVNCTDEPVQVKIFEPGSSHAVAQLNEVFDARNVSQAIPLARSPS